MTIPPVSPSPSDPESPKSSAPQAEFERQAEGDSASLVRELFDFIRENKVWWMAPIVVVLLLVGLLIVLSSTVIAPFIYPLF